MKRSSGEIRGKASRIGRLPFPLLAPDEPAREGYVPRVLYSWNIAFISVSDPQAALTG